MKKKLIIVASLFLIAFLFSTSSVFASNENEYDLHQESLKLNQEIEKILEDVPDLEVPEEENEISTFMSSSSYKPRAGDILYTPSTQCKNDKNICKGITGHVGIVSITGSNVYHIANKKSKPKSIKKATWFKNYKKTTVIRPNSKSKGDKAARWAYNHYVKGKGKNKSYKVTFSRSTGLKTTYCSLIPWQGYAKGANHYMGSEFGGYMLPQYFVVDAKSYGMKVHGKIGY
ncbi:hypothetical protein GT022_08435 [Agaribacter marinus]|uniref:CHAP domain-containing protein n=1 Tax=Virgibacillus salarius TaxID=447199 RepID=A0A941DS31_9BACI|nr:hypothetical protein [Virgibacillus salarius]MBR7796074.1 hypothetical protein [Virgibacillus salarius]NAZ08785.1 hypothetical protein [Agaribacter marinus]